MHPSKEWCHRTYCRCLLKLKVAQWRLRFPQIVGNKVKGESQNGCFKKTKHAKFSEKRTFLIPWYAHVGVRIMGLEMFIFRKILRALFSRNTRFEIHPFALFRRNIFLLYFGPVCLFFWTLVFLGISANFSLFSVNS